MQPTNSEIARLLQSYLTPPADYEDSSTPSVFFMAESGSVALLPTETRALDVPSSLYTEVAFTDVSPLGAGLQ